MRRFTWGTVQDWRHSFEGIRHVAAERPSLVLFMFDLGALFGAITNEANRRRGIRSARTRFCGKRPCQSRFSPPKQTRAYEESPLWVAEVYQDGSNVRCIDFAISLAACALRSSWFLALHKDLRALLCFLLHFFVSFLAPFVSLAHCALSLSLFSSPAVLSQFLLFSLASSSSS